MPLMVLKTNVELSESQKSSLLPQASALLAKLLHKPESYVLVAIEAGISMSFAGNTAPLAYLEVKSLGLPDEATTALSHALCQWLGEALSIESSRVYIEFASPLRHHWGWDNKTF